MFVLLWWVQVISKALEQAEEEYKGFERRDAKLIIEQKNLHAKVGGGCGSAEGGQRLLNIPNLCHAGHAPGMQGVQAGCKAKPRCMHCSQVKKLTSKLETDTAQAAVSGKSTAVL